MVLSFYRFIVVKKTQSFSIVFSSWKQHFIIIELLFYRFIFVVVNLEAILTVYEPTNVKIPIE